MAGMEVDLVFDDLDWKLGQLFMMGFEGTQVTPQIRKLIEVHHLGTVLLTAKNLKNADQTAKLVLELQQIARDANHPVPLAIALDQENGGVNSLFDADFVQQFPSAMGIAASGSTEMAFEVAKATAEELAAVGINWIMGPCLDVLTNIKNQPLGVRSSGDDPEEVSRYGIAAMNGYKDAGLATCGKHFPSYGNLEFLGSALDVPVITDSIEQLSANALGPFRDAISQGVDAMMVGGCAMSSAGVEAMHACLSDQVVNDLLRKEMGFKGVVISECLEMEALSHNIGVGGGTVMAVNAGCDLILVCRSFASQQEAFSGLKAGLDNELITPGRIQESLERILHMKSTCMSWQKALTPGGIATLSPLQPSHAQLSEKAYNSSITVVRDKERLLPLINSLHHDDELLLLTPLVKPLPASAASQALRSENDSPEPPSASWQRAGSGMSGENVFRELGRSLARLRGGRVLHTSYTANGLRPVHENLINRASAVIVVTADANRNLYQHGFTKHVSMICRLSQRGEKREKPLVVVSVSSPYDFAMESSLGTYICTFDFTETAMQALVNVLHGQYTPTGTLPGSLRQNQKVHQSKQHWLVEKWDRERDAHGLDALLINIHEEDPEQASVLAHGNHKTFSLDKVQENHFVVRNTTTHALYGFCPTYFFESTETGVVGPILVDPERRNLSIGQSLHKRAVKALLQCQGIRRLQLGSRLPNTYLGIPSRSSLERKRLRQWFDDMGWVDSPSRLVCNMVLSNLAKWEAPERSKSTVHNGEVEFDLIHGGEHSLQVLELVRASSRLGVAEIYQLALENRTGCGIIRAKRRTDSFLLGAVVLYNASASWADAIPSIKDDVETMGGISSPVVSPNAGDYSTVLQGLILLGAQQHKKEGATAVLLDYVDDDANLDHFSAMGFRLLNSFDEISCDAASFASYS